MLIQDFKSYHLNSLLSHFYVLARKIDLVDKKGIDASNKGRPKYFLKKMTCARYIYLPKKC